MPIDPRAFGPSQTQRDTQTAISAASTANKVAGIGGYGVPYADTLLGLAGLFTNPTPQNAALFAGRTVTSPQFAQWASRFFDGAGAAGSTAGGLTASGMTGSEAALAGGNAATGAAGGASSASSLGAAGAGAIMSLFAGGGPLAFLGQEPGPVLEKRAHRARDAGQLGKEIMQGLQARDLSTEVGGSTVGDALASMVNFNQGGGWFSDTGHNWLPDPRYSGLKRLFEDRGYLGTRVENGEIVKREPSANDVGGVGEIVQGGGLQVWDPHVPRWTPDTKVYEEQYINSLPESPYLSGPRAWESILLRLAGMGDTPITRAPVTVPRGGSAESGEGGAGFAPTQYITKPAWSVFDLSPEPIVAEYGVAESGEGGAGYIPPQYAPNPAWDEYMALVDAELPEAAQRVRDTQAARDLARSYDARWGTG